MNEPSIGVRSETRALKRSVQAAVVKQRRRYQGVEQIPLVLLDSCCSDLPVALIEAADLAPIDKVIWLVLMIRACNAAGVTKLPTHTELANVAKVAARQTVARSLTVLRCRRWMTVCQTSVHRGGRRVASAYALHASPLPIADTIYLDPQYQAFLEALAGQQQLGLKKIANEVLAQLVSSNCENIRHSV